MEAIDIKNILLSHIERIGQDANALKKVLDYIESIYTDNYRPAIANNNLTQYIKEDSDIIVPFVCEDMFEYIKDGQSLSIGEYLCHEYQRKWNIREETAKVMKTNLYFGISLYEQDNGGKNRANAIYNAINDGIKNGEIKLKGCVRDFLIKGDYPVIVTTIGFGILESELYGYTPRWYNPNGKNDLPLIISEHTRVVYHLFGGERYDSWGYNDPTLFKFVHGFHNRDFAPRDLSNYLRGTGNNRVKRPLILGSTFPDWLFRFFIFPLFGDKFSESNGYWISLDEIEKGLDTFLNRNKFTGEINLRRGNRINEVLTSAAAEHEEINSGDKKSHHDKKPYNLFFSYKREDNSDTIDRVDDILRMQAKDSGGNVWRDKHEVSDGGNPYWANIKRAVKDCNLFVAIVTEPYLNEYLDAPNIEEYANEQPFHDASTDDANDEKIIQNLPNVVREAYYAIRYGKKCVPIVIANKEGTMTRGVAEDIIKNEDDRRNLPPSLFAAHTALQHDDNNPQVFDLPQID